VSLADARQRARDIVAAAGRGVDLLATEAAATALDAAQAVRPATVGDLAARYVEERCKINQRRWKVTSALLRDHVTPAIGGTPLAALRRADIVEMFDDLQNEKGLRAQVNRVRSQVVAMLNWALEREWIDANPAAGIKKRPGEAPRQRSLTDDELRAVWRAADALPAPSGPFVKMLILTGQRRDEVRCLQWGEVSETAKTWTLPAARNKGKRDHYVPLSDPALALLTGTTRQGDYVFTVDGRKPYAGTKRLKAILDRHSGVTGWVLHDIRRTVRSGLSRLHVADEVADRIMNHARPSLDKTYNRHRYVDEMRAALAAWASHVAVVAGDVRDVANVVTLRSA
jgi:integrase